MLFRSPEHGRLVEQKGNRHQLGKAKTIAQMVAIPFLLYQAPVLWGLIDTAAWGYWLIRLAAILTFVSMVYYLAKAWPELRGRL